MGKQKKQNVICDYCHQPAHLRTGDQVHPHRPDLTYLFFWVCDKCDARVGCHKNSPSHHPLGRLSSAKLRGWKSKAHLAFDRLWQSPSMSRTQAYQWLAEVMNKDIKEAHIGRFNVMECQKAVAFCNAFVEEDANWQPKTIKETEARIAEETARAKKEQK